MNGRGSTHGPRCFVGRAAESAQFLELLNQTVATRPILMFYGAAGSGKSSLLAHLRGVADRHRVPTAVVDLAEAPDPGEALVIMASQLAQTRFKFDSFWALVALIGARASGTVPAAAHRGLQVAGTLTDAVLDVLGLVPLVAQLASLIKLEKRLLGAALAEANKDPRLRSFIANIGGQRELLELLGRPVAELEVELVRRFALCLSRHRRNRGGSVAVLFFDSHEVLWWDGAGGAFAHDAWIRELHRHVRETGVCIVLAGRERLEWGDEWQQTKEQADGIWLRQVRLAGLARTDATEFLRCVDAASSESQPGLPADLQEAVLRVTNESSDKAAPSRHHCFLLRLCADIISNTRSATGAYPTAAGFRSIPPGAAAARPLAESFLRSLRSQSLVNWLRELSLTPRFDEGFALALDQHRGHYNGRAGWDRLRTLSSIEERDGGLLQMHPLLQRVLRTSLPPAERNALHTWALKHWSDRISGGPGSSTNRWPLAWYHQRFVDHPAALSLFARSYQHAMDLHANAQAMRHLVGWWRDVEVSRTSVGISEARDLHLYGWALARLPTGDRNANVAEALACLNAALAFYTEQEYPSEWARVQVELGGAHASSPREDSHSEAIACYSAALRIITEAGSPHEWAQVQHSLGVVYTALTDDRAEHLARAIACFEAALRVRMDDGSPIDWANTQNALGAAYAQLPDGDEDANRERAIACFRGALTVFTEHEAPLDWAITLANLGAALIDLRTGSRDANLEAAVASLGAAGRVFTETDFAVEWARIQSNLGHAYVHLGNVTLAVGCFEAALRVFNEAYFPVEWRKATDNLTRARTGRIYEAR